MKDEHNQATPSVTVDTLPDDVLRALTDARALAMKNTADARAPECGDFGAIAQNLDWALIQLSAPQQHAQSEGSRVTGNTPAQPIAGELPPLPEMDGLQDIQYALNTPDDWDADYANTWSSLQVAERNKMQWRAHALMLRSIIEAYGHQCRAAALEAAEQAVLSVHAENEIADAALNRAIAAIRALNKTEG